MNAKVVGNVPMKNIKPTPKTVVIPPGAGVKSGKSVTVPAPAPNREVQKLKAELAEAKRLQGNSQQLSEIQYLKRSLKTLKQDLDQLAQARIGLSQTLVACGVTKETIDRLQDPKLTGPLSMIVAEAYNQARTHLLSTK